MAEQKSFRVSQKANSNIPRLLLSSYQRGDPMRKMTDGNELKNVSLEARIFQSLPFRQTRHVIKQKVAKARQNFDGNNLGQAFNIEERYCFNFAVSTLVDTLVIALLFFALSEKNFMLLKTCYAIQLSKRSVALCQPDASN